MLRMIREIFWVINAGLMIGHSSRGGFFLISSNELWASTGLAIDKDTMVVRIT